MTPEIVPHAAASFNVHLSFNVSKKKILSLIKADIVSEKNI
jgi:hypothetical protein